MNDEQGHSVVARRYSAWLGQAYIQCKCGWSARVVHHFDSEKDGRAWATDRANQRHAEHISAQSYPVEA